MAPPSYRWRAGGAMRLLRVRGVPLAGVPSQRWAKLLRERPMNRCSEDQSVTAKITRLEQPANGPRRASPKSLAISSGSLPKASHPHAPSTMSRCPCARPTASTFLMRARIAGSIALRRVGSTCIETDSAPAPKIHPSWLLRGTYREAIRPHAGPRQPRRSSTGGRAALSVRSLYGQTVRAAHPAVAARQSCR